MTLYKNGVCTVSYGDDSPGHMSGHSVGQGIEKRAYQ
jgi:hypothetical protein